MHDVSESLIAMTRTASVTIDVTTMALDRDPEAVEQTVVLAGRLEHGRPALPVQPQAAQEASTPRPYPAQVAAPPFDLAIAELDIAGSLLAGEKPTPSGPGALAAGSPRAEYESQLGLASARHLLIDWKS